jgi:carboxypeptidase Taq
MSSASTDYNNLIEALQEIAVIASVNDLVAWDRQIMMPPGSTAWRAEQASVMASLVHQKRSDERLVGLINSLLESDSISAEQRIVVEQSWKTIKRAVLVPESLVKELAQASAETDQVWQRAKRESNFSIVSSKLAELISLKQAYADCLSEGRPRYDTLIDDYEPEEKAENLTELFQALKLALMPIVENAQGEASYPLDRPISAELQLSLCNDIAEVVGYSLEHGRIDTSAHPFCRSVGAKDVRVSTYFDEFDIRFGLLAAAHEFGHALYEQGVKVKHYGTPLAEYCSMGIHESQSLLWENHIGRSPEFWSFVCRKLQDRGEVFGEVDLVNKLTQAVNVVQPSLIRISADEITYPLHIIIRFELEKQIVDGSLEVSELPEAWNSAYEEVLGIRPANDREGVLQDIHWYFGAFGYFPSYALGAIYAAQLYETFCNEHKIADSLNLPISSYSLLKAWLAKHIYQVGRTCSAKELIKRATGKEASIDSFVSYAQRKFA